MTTIPVLDYATFSGRHQTGLRRSLGRGRARAGLSGGQEPRHPETLIADMFAKADAFFALPKEVKDEVSIDKSPNNRGYAGTGSEALDEKSGQMDQKEAYNMAMDFAADDPRVLRGDPYRGPNMWPDGVPGFKETFSAYFDAVLDLGVNLHRAIALDLDLEEDFFAQHFDESMSTLRVLRYPEAKTRSPARSALAPTPTMARSRC
jgi:isopenicillin N synthase-like dioxygenase